MNDEEPHLLGHDCSARAGPQRPSVYGAESPRVLDHRACIHEWLDSRLDPRDTRVATRAGLGLRGVLDPTSPAEPGIGCRLFAASAPRGTFSRSSQGRTLTGMSTYSCIRPAIKLGAWGPDEGRGNRARQPWR